MSSGLIGLKEGEALRDEILATSASPLHEHRVNGLRTSVICPLLSCADNCVACKQTEYRSQARISFEDLKASKRPIVLPFVETLNLPSDPNVEVVILARLGAVGRGLTNRREDIPVDVKKIVHFT